MVKEEDRIAVVNYLNGTCKGDYEAAESLGLDEAYVLDCIIQDQEIECCARCGWWIEMAEIYEVDSDCVCKDCCTEQEIEDNA